LTFDVLDEDVSHADRCTRGTFCLEHVWSDLVSTTPREEQSLEGLLGVDAPTCEEMQATQATSRSTASRLSWKKLRGGRRS
jgi:hypothetical protein